MKLADEEEGLIRLVERNWVHPLGLVAAEMLALAVLAGLFLIVEAPSVVRGAVLLVALGGVYFAWCRSRAMPKCPKGKIGFAVSIACGVDVDHQRIRQDFLRTLRSLIQSGSTGSKFHFMEFPQNIATTIVGANDPLPIHKKCGAHFLLYGQVRKGTIDSKSNLVLDVQGSVRHAPIAGSNRANLTREFAELLPFRAIINSPEDIFSFEFRAEAIHLVSRYIIGIAAFVSGDINFADSLYGELQARLEAKNQDVPIVKQLVGRLPRRRIEVRIVRCDRIIREWEKERNPEFVVALGEVVQELEALNATDYAVAMARSMYLFLQHRDVSGSIQTLERWKGPKDATWHYNMAFLYAYRGDLDQMSREYRRAKELREEPGMFVRIETFICWVLEQEPDKHPLHFALGYLNLKIKNDLELARGDFSRFLASTNPDQYRSHRRLAETYLAAIERTLSQRGDGTTQ